MTRKAIIPLIGSVAVLLVSLMAFLSIGNGMQPAVNGVTEEPVMNDPQPIEQQPTMRDMIEQWRKELPGSSALVITNLSTAQTFAYDENEPFTSASLYKLYIAYLTLQDVDRGRLSLDSSIEIINGDQLDRESQTRIVRDCLRDMIIVSDNPCGEALGRRIGWATVDSRLRTQGYQDTALNNYTPPGQEEVLQKTTASDVSRLLVKLYEDDLLSEESTRLFQQWLSEQTINGRVPDRPDVEFAHKTANLYDVFHDAGYVSHRGQDIVYVILTSGWEGDFFDRADESFRDILNKLVDSIQLTS